MHCYYTLDYKLKCQFFKPELSNCDLFLYFWSFEIWAPENINICFWTIFQNPEQELLHNKVSRNKPWHLNRTSVFFFFMNNGLND